MLPPLWTNDVSLMKHALLQDTDNQLCRINYCQMYLGVTYLSELCSVDGRFLLDGFLTGRPTKVLFWTTYNRPCQQRLNTWSWTMWARLLDSLALPTGQLCQRLRWWTSDHSTTGHWDAYHDPESSKIFGYNTESSTWSSYIINDFCLQLHEVVIPDFSPVSSLIPNQIDWIHSTVTSDLSVAVLVPQTVPHGPPRSWPDFLVRQPSWIRKLLRSIRVHDTIDTILEEYNKHGLLLLVSDGTAKDQVMAFGWTLASPDGRRLMIAAGPCSGRSSSLRSKSAGMLSGSLFIGLLFHYMRQPTVNVTSVSDNLELIWRQQAHQHYSFPYANETMRAEFDLKQIYLTQKTYNISPTFIHVKGHQDKHRKYSELSLYAQLNVDADASVGDYWEKLCKYSPVTMLLPACPAVLSICGVSITNDYKRQLENAFTEPRYIDFLQQKYGWSDFIVQSIAWKCLSRALRQIDRQVVLVKLLHDLLPTAKILQKRKWQRSDMCSLCSKVEDHDHVLRCSHETQDK